MRKSVSLPSPVKKKGGGKQEEPKASLTKLLAPYKDFQSGGDLQSGGYKPGAHIAAGADGDVFRAISHVLKREVAIKRIKVTSTVISRHVHQEVSAVFHARKMYGFEVEDLSSLGHPCIVGYLDWFAGPGGVDREVCIAMELCNFGIGDLIHTGNVMRVEYEKMAKSKMPLHHLQAGIKGKPAASGIDPKLYRFPEREILKVLFQMLSALTFLNRHGIFHRDLKSENILWKQRHPQEGSYKLADFGVAFCENDGDASGKRHDDCGTLWTMAPELLGKRPGAGPSCDVWSLAVVLFEMCFFDKPFNSLELLSYRNAGAESSDGFWNSLCGEKKGQNSSSSGPRCGFAGPSSPTSTMGGGFGKPKPSRILTKQASLPSLTSASPKQSSCDSQSSPSSPSTKLGRAFLRTRTVGALSSAAPSPMAPSRGISTDDDVLSPSCIPASPASPSSDLRSRRRAFLRKRGSLRWIYSEELRNLIFEDMLEEDASIRPKSADCLDSFRLQGLLAPYELNAWGSPEDVARCSTLVAATISPDAPSDPASPIGGAACSERPLSRGSNTAQREKRPSTSSAGDDAAAVANAAASASPTNAAIAGAAEPQTGNSLHCLTPEAFLEVLKVDRKFDPCAYSQQNYSSDIACEAGVLTTVPYAAELS